MSQSNENAVREAAMAAGLSGEMATVVGRCAYMYIPFFYGGQVQVYKIYLGGQVREKKVLGCIVNCYKHIIAKALVCVAGHLYSVGLPLPDR